MSYPKRFLSADEVIEAEFRPHWSGLLREGLTVLAGIAVAVLLSFIDVSGWWYIVLAGLVVVLITRGLIKWLTTLHVITTERVIYRAGFIAKRGQGDTSRGDQRRRVQPDHL